jgi:hypothetical protein
VFPTANGGTAFAFDGSAYTVRDTLVAGSGYWTKLPASLSQVIWGNPLPSLNVPVAAGWNLVGSVDHPVAAPSDGIIESFFYEFTASGYAPVATLQPGRGYWVKTSAAGTISIGPAPARDGAAGIEKFARLTVRDGKGSTRKLFIAQADGSTAGSLRYSAPPPPPQGALDVRFGSQRLVETVDALSAGETVLPLLITGGSRPLHFGAGTEPAAGVRFVIEERRGAEVVASGELTAGGDVVLPGSPGNTLVLRIIPGTAVPTEFALLQNYPNPFNPSTTLRYDLPVDGRVTLRIYDMAGREVATLVDENQKAGYRSVTWQAGNLASGVYLYRVRSGDFTQARKMLLLK